MDTEFYSIGQLGDFLDFYNLLDQWGRCQFNGRIDFVVGGKSSTYYTKVRVEMQGYDKPGKITIVHDDLDAEDYPIEVSANFQRYKFVDSTSLQIEGSYPKGDRRGRYSITIVPEDINT